MLPSPPEPRIQNPADVYRSAIGGHRPVSALAPMQAVSSLEYWQVMHRRGGPDLYFTEYFRVHSTSRLDRFILRSIDENETGKPVIAQMIGNDIPCLVATAKELAHHPIAGIDLNLGCPAPIVYKKCAGGGLLREPERIDAILGALRQAIDLPFSVKTRLGFDTADEFPELMKVFARHDLDLLTLHGRTVKQMYRSAVDYRSIRMAAANLPFPVLMNGNIHSAKHALTIQKDIQGAGWMIGRGAIRNPWIFDQIRQEQNGEAIVYPTGQDVLAYIQDLYDTLRYKTVSDEAHITRLKKYLNFIGLGIDPQGHFLHAIRQSRSEQHFFDTCRGFLNHSDPMTLEPMDIPMKPRDVLAGVHR